MATPTTERRRYPFTRETQRMLGTVVHSSLDVSKLKPSTSDPSADRPIGTRHELRAYQDLYARRRAIRMCGVRGMFCRSARCARCSSRRSAEIRQRIVDAIDAAPEVGRVLMWTATVRHSPGQALAHAWRDLDALISRVTYGQWLARNVGGYARVTEIEYTPGGWHPHAHTILVFGNETTAAEARQIGERVVTRYLDAAERLGIPAERRAQDVRLWDLAEAVGYVTKSHMTTGDTRKPGTLTPAMLLRDAARGDADADAMLAEIDGASRGRRLIALGGSLGSRPRNA